MAPARDAQTAPPKGRPPDLPSGKVYDLGAPRPTPRLRLKDIRRRLLALSFALCVALPIGLATLYFGLIASDRYAASAAFSVRGIEAGIGLDGIGALTGLASTGSTTADSYVVLDYLESRALVEALEARTAFRQSASNPTRDRLTRLSPDAPVEDLVAYWRRQIETSFDPTSGILRFTVQSTTPEHARDLARAILSLTQALVNDLSARARHDALQFAETEVKRQEDRLRKALAALRQFRASAQSLDPSASAALDIELLATLEARLLDLNARITSVSAQLDADAPSLAALRAQAGALEEQISARRRLLSATDAGPDTALPDQLSAYETLEVERRFAEQAYASALASLEQARRDADRNQRYLAVHLEPALPQAAEYPHRIRATLLIAFAATALWGIGTLLTYSVRDHLS